MSDTDGYNGWSNYPTWAVHLWLTNDQGTDDYWIETAREIRDHAKLIRVELADALKNEVRGLSEPDETFDGASLQSDLLGFAFDQVNWYEIADAFLAVTDDEDEILDQGEDARAIEDHQERKHAARDTA